MPEPLYDPEVDAWLESLVESDPDVLDRVEDQIDLLREVPLGARARRRSIRGRDNETHWVITFEFRQQAWVLVWTSNPDNEPVVVAIEPTDSP